MKRYCDFLESEGHVSIDSYLGDYDTNKKKVVQGNIVTKKVEKRITCSTYIAVSLFSDEGAYIIVMETRINLVAGLNIVVGYRISLNEVSLIFDFQTTGWNLLTKPVRESAVKSLNSEALEKFWKSL